jgi:hypothetical protein
MSNCESRKNSNSDAKQSFAQNMEDRDEINHISVFRLGPARWMRFNDRHPANTDQQPGARAIK